MEEFEIELDMDARVGHVDPEAGLRGKLHHEEFNIDAGNEDVAPEVEVPGKWTIECVLLSTDALVAGTDGT